MSEHPFDLTRCDRCNWALAKERESGCVVGDCAYRGENTIGMNTPEEQRLREVYRSTLAGIPSPDAALRELVEAMSNLLDLIDENGYVDPHGDDVQAARAALEPFAALGAEQEDKT